MEVPEQKRLCLGCETQIKPDQESEVVKTRRLPAYRHTNYQDCSDALRMVAHSSPYANSGMIDC